MDDFDKCTTMIRHNDTGIVMINCRLGLWSVKANTRELTMREAMVYFNQYKADGEYHSIIGGKTPLEVLIND
nr:hypothetical protein 1 [Piscirickettsiaceae bacterium]